MALVGRALMGHALVGGALMGRAIVGRALMGRVRVGRALLGPALVARVLPRPGPHGSPLGPIRQCQVIVPATPKDETQKTNHQQGQKLVRTEDEDVLAPRPGS